MGIQFRRSIAEIKDAGEFGSGRLGTAQWMIPREAAAALCFSLTTPTKQIWIGEDLGSGTPLGYDDDQHVCLVSGPRGGKGAGIIIPNLCRWPGSAVVVDPKGGNATVTAERRGTGSAYAEGMEQKVYNLDPFDEATLDPSLKARFNALDTIDPTGRFAVDDAALIAAALVARESSKDHFFEDAARILLKGLILHVLTWPAFAGKRNLITVRDLLSNGDQLELEKAKRDGAPKTPSAHMLLWDTMRCNPAFNGVVSGVGERFLHYPDKTRMSVLAVADTATEFIDSAPMQEVLAASDFSLDELKTDPKGVTIYLTLPRRYAEKNIPWLRLMVSLAASVMERIKEPPAARTGDGKPCPTLFVLDEFPGLKRMEVVEDLAAQGAEVGIKFLFVVQNLPQLKEVYGDAWENFISCSGLKLFFHIEDGFTRDYVSRLVGETEVQRTTHSGSKCQSEGRTSTDGTSSSKNTGTSKSHGGSNGQAFGYNGLLRVFSDNESHQDAASWTQSTSGGKSTGTSFSQSKSLSESVTSGWNESIHKRALANPDEIGRFFAKTNDSDDRRFPGLVLALMPGKYALPVRRVDYWRSRHFEGMFGPHPLHGPIPTLAERRAKRGTAWRATLLLAAPIANWVRKAQRTAGVLACGTIAAALMLGFGAQYFRAATPSLREAQAAQTAASNKDATGTAAAAVRKADSEPIKPSGVPPLAVRFDPPRHADIGGTITSWEFPGYREVRFAKGTAVNAIGQAQIPVTRPDGTTQPQLFCVTEIGNKAHVVGINKINRATRPGFCDPAPAIVGPPPASSVRVRSSRRATLQSL